MKIRLATPFDEAQIIQIVKPQISPAFHWPEEQMRSELVMAQCWVLEEESQICAFVCLRDMVEAWEISVLATRQESQKQGLMKALLAEMIHLFGSRRQLWLEVHEKNLSACKLYEKLGFKEQGQRGGYYADGSSAILYTYFC